MRASDEAELFAELRDSCTHLHQLNTYSQAAFLHLGRPSRSTLYGDGQNYYIMSLRWCVRACACGAECGDVLCPTIMFALAGRERAGRREKRSGTDAAAAQKTDPVCKKRARWMQNMRRGDGKKWPADVSLRQKLSTLKAQSVPQTEEIRTPAADGFWRHVCVCVRALFAANCPSKKPGALSRQF